MISRAAWLTWLLLLGIIWALAWLKPEWHHYFAHTLQNLYGTPFATSPWYLRGNAPMHVFMTMQATLCLITGMRLLLPRYSPWWGIVGAVLIAVCDELAQRWSAVRGFDVRDWESDVAGLTLALVLWGAWTLRRRHAANSAAEDRH